ncbi:MAG: hypothetical protein AB7N76_31705 [Planctomycetota bacterium]
MTRRPLSRPGLAARPGLAFGLLLLLALPCAAQPHPFGGEVLDLVGEAEQVRAATTPAARQQASERFLKTLYRDPYLKELGPRMHLERFVSALAAGEPFDAAAFRAAAKDAVARHQNLTADVGVAELTQKMQVVELAFTTRRAGPGAPRGPPVDAGEFARHDMAEVLNKGDTKLLSMERVPGASVLLLNDRVSLPGEGSRTELALDLYGRVLTGEGGGHGDLRGGLAHREVGRAVLSPTRTHPLGAETADVLKGVGPTPFAGNRFNSKATGTFPLPEAVRDWNQTETLRKAGVAIYEPVAIVALPYMEWSASEGWRPVAVYVRRPRENLRVSDLDHLSDAKKRLLLEKLRGKMQAELTGVGRADALSDVDVVRMFVERMGRTAGIFQGGIGEGRYYFHGMLHDQNVSLMGEIVDVGNSDGVLESREAMRKAWEASNYTWWPEKLKEYKDLKGNVETAVLFRLARRYNEALKSVTGGGMSEAELTELFKAAYREGRRGVSASDPKLTLRARTPEAVAKKLDELRRPDGTVEWSKVARDRALVEGAGLANFTLALFLKELAAVAATGDRARIEEFFDGLLTTDFYEDYGLFVAGAKLGEVAYTRYLQRFVKPRFVNGVLKTNLVLATGMALPLIVEGKFEGKAFAISVASLGLSSAAVKAGVAGIEWVLDISKAREAGVLARLSGAGRLAKLGGWFYTAAELAVVLYVADELETRVNAALDQKAARDALAAAGRDFLAATRGGRTQEVEAAAEAYHQAWIDYRNFLYRPLEQDELVLAERLQRSARQAKLLADKRAATLERVSQQPALRQSIERRYGSLEAYADALAKEEEEQVRAEVNTYLDSYNKTRAEHLRAVYEDGRRRGALLGGLDDLDWLLRGGEAHAAGDPFGSRDDVFASWGRGRARGRLDDALGGASANRLQAYDDEAEVFAAVAGALRRSGRGDLADLLDARRRGVLQLQAMDKDLVRTGGVVDTRNRAGISERMRAATPGR